MKIIKCDPLEVGHFVRTIEYAKTKKKEEYDNGLLTKEGYDYDITILNRLLERCKGNYQGDYHGQSKKVLSKQDVLDFDLL